MADADTRADKSDSLPGVVQSTGDEEFAAARVLDVGETVANQKLFEATGVVANRQPARVEILEGSHRGETVRIYNEVTDNPVFNIHIKPGSEVVLSISRDAKNNFEYNVADYHRAPALGILLATFLVAFVFFGGKQGVKSLAALVISVCLIAFVLLPLSLQGANPLLVSIFICFATTGATVYFVSGWSRKSAAALLGTVGGVIVAGLAAQLVISGAPLTGLSSEEAQILRGSVLERNPAFYQGLLAAGMLIGALGVIMDVAVSIASAVTEVSRTAGGGGGMSFKALYDSGMNVGRDIMGTMTNTLILAYTGGALPLLLLTSQIPPGKLVNLDLVATEVASAISGSLGLVLTIPLTAFFAARLMAHTQK